MVSQTRLQHIYNKPIQWR